MPYGTIVVTHFETYKRKRILGGDKVEEIEFTAETQLKGLIASPFVALNVNGKIEKNKVLVYDQNRDLSEMPNAADIVIAWAIEQGMKPIVPISDQKPVSQDDLKFKAMTERQNDLELRIASVDSKLDRILEGLSSKIKV
jgi:hypothetical protein